MSYVWFVFWLLCLFDLLLFICCVGSTPEYTHCVLCKLYQLVCGMYSFFLLFFVNHYCCCCCCQTTANDYAKCLLNIVAINCVLKLIFLSLKYAQRIEKLTSGLISNMHKQQLLFSQDQFVFSKNGCENTCVCGFRLLLLLLDSDKPDNL